MQTPSPSSKFSAKALIWSLPVLGIALIGCGGGGGGVNLGSGTSGTSGGSTGSTNPTALPHGTASFHVDLKTGKVTVTPFGTATTTVTGKKAPVVFNGNTIGFTSSVIVDVPGDTGEKVLNVSLTNNWGQAIGAATGVNVLFSPIYPVSSSENIESSINVTTKAGDGVGKTNGPALQAQFNEPSGMAYNPADNSLWICDTNNNQIRKIASNGVTTVAGSGTASDVDGTGSAATFNTPVGIAYNAIDQSFIVADYGGNKIRRVTLTGSVTTVAGTGATGVAMGAGTAATFTKPVGVAVTPSGTIYVSATDNIIRKITLTGTNPRVASSYTVSLFAGSSAGHFGFADAVGSAALFYHPDGLALDPSGNLYVADQTNQKIRIVSPSAEVSTIAGTGGIGNANGAGNAAEFDKPIGLVYDNGLLFISNSANNFIQAMGLAPGATAFSAINWNVVDVAGTGSAGSANGLGSSASFSFPYMMTADSAGNIYVADYHNSLIREIQPVNGSFSVGTLGGPIVSLPISLANATGVTPDSDFGQELPYITYPGPLAASQTSASQQWAFVIPAGVTAFNFNVSVESDTPTLTQPGASSGVGSSAVDVRTFAGAVNGHTGYTNGSLTEAQFGPNVAQLAMDPFGNVYLADTTNNAVRIITPQGIVGTVVGVPGNNGAIVNGTGLTGSIDGPSGVAVTPDGKYIYVSESFGRVIGCISVSQPGSTDPSTYTVQTISSGTNVGGTLTDYGQPQQITITAGGNIYLTDSANGQVVKLQFFGGDRMLAADYSASVFVNGLTEPNGIAADLAGNLYVCQPGAHVIDKITPDAASSTFAGNGSLGYQDGLTAEFSAPTSVCVDSAGYLYVTDSSGNSVRRITTTGFTETVAGANTKGDLDGLGNVAELSDPLGICISPSGTIYFYDGGVQGALSNSIRTIQAIVTNNNAPKSKK